MRWGGGRGGGGGRGVWRMDMLRVMSSRLISGFDIEWPWPIQHSLVLSTTVVLLFFFLLIFFFCKKLGENYDVLDVEWPIIRENPV